MSVNCFTCLHIYLWNIQLTLFSLLITDSSTKKQSLITMHYLLVSIHFKAPSKPRISETASLAPSPLSQPQWVEKCRESRLSDAGGLHWRHFRPSLHKAWPHVHTQTPIWVKRLLCPFSQWPLSSQGIMWVYCFVSILLRVARHSDAQSEYISSQTITLLFGFTERHQLLKYASVGKKRMKFA